MKVKDIYAMIAIIFATNFKAPLSEEQFKKIAPNWILKNETQENKKAHELWHKAIKGNQKEIEEDFDNLKEFFDMDKFKLISQSDINMLFESKRYIKPFNELKASHSANMLGFLAAILKQDDNEKVHEFLIIYLAKYFIESFRALSEHLKINAKSDYYKALGWFLDDYLKMLKITLGLKN